MWSGCRQVGWECWACPAGLDREYLALLLSPQSVFTLEKVLPGPSFILTGGTSPYIGLLLSTAALRTAEVWAARGGQCFDTFFSQNINFIWGKKKRKLKKGNLSGHDISVTSASWQAERMMYQTRHPELAECVPTGRCSMIYLTPNISKEIFAVEVTRNKTLFVLLPTNYSGCPKWHHLPFFLLWSSIYEDPGSQWSSEDRDIGWRESLAR